MPVNDPGGPTFIPISLVPDVPDIVTGPTSVGFNITVPPNQVAPPLTVTFYQVQNQPGPVAGQPIPEQLPMELIQLPNNPTPIWHEDYARFTVDLTQAVLNMLYSRKSLLAVAVTISTEGVNSLGLAGIPIDLPDPPQS